MECTQMDVNKLDRAFIYKQDRKHLVPRSNNRTLWKSGSSFYDLKRLSTTARLQYYFKLVFSDGAAIRNRFRQIQVTQSND